MQSIRRPSSAPGAAKIPNLDVPTAAFGSLAQRLAAQRLDSARRRRVANAPAAAPPPTSAPSLVRRAVKIAEQPSGVQCVARSLSAREPSSKPRPFNPLGLSQAVNQRPLTPPPGSKKPGVPGAPSKPPKKKELGASALRSIAERHNDRAARLIEDVRRRRASQDLSAQLGEALHVRKVDLKALTSGLSPREGSGVTKADFRSLVRKHLLPQADLAQVDALFTTMTLSLEASAGSGSGGGLSVRDLRAALKGLQDKAALAGEAAVADSANQEAARLCARGAQAEQAARAAEMVDESEARLARMRAEPCAEARLGALVNDAKLVELVIQAEKAEEAVTRLALLDALKASGVATAELGELDARLFAGLEVGEGGGLDAAAIKKKLRELQAHAARGDADALTLARTCAMLRKAFTMQRTALLQALSQDDEQPAVTPSGEERCRMPSLS